jgi:hypothetical protein
VIALAFLGFTALGALIGWAACLTYIDRHWYDDDESETTP